MNGHEQRELAHCLAIAIHDGQIRKGAGEEYIRHCERVADRVDGWRRKALAYLHDSIEDADTDEARDFLKSLFDTLFGHDFTVDLLYLSRLPQLSTGEKLPYSEWIRDMARTCNTDVLAVKLADIDDNLADIGDIPDAGSLKLRYERARPILQEAYNQINGFSSTET